MAGIDAAGCTRVNLAIPAPRAGASLVAYARTDSRHSTLKLEIHNGLRPAIALRTLHIFGNDQSRRCASHGPGRGLAAG